MANYLVRHMFSLIQKRFLQSSTTLSSVPPIPTAATSSSSFTVEYLVNSCGLSLKSALSVSKKFQFNEKTPQNPQAVLQLLRSHHFSDTLIAQLIVKRPQVLNCRVQNYLQPKFEYISKNGFQGELLSHIIVSNPRILKVSLDSQIKPSFEFLRLFLDSDEKILGAVKRAPWLLTTNLKIKLQPIINVLMKEGVPAHVVGRFLNMQTRLMLHTPEKILHAVNSLRKMGFESTDTMFIHALRVMIQMSESTWNKKIQVMKSMGFNEEDILKNFKRFPYCLGYSEENIRKTLQFYLNTMKLERQAISENPSLIGYSIEKRVSPRYHVLKVLESKKLIQGIKLRSFTIGDKEFQDKYIEPFLDELPNLKGFYRGIKEAKSPVDAEEVAQYPVRLSSDSEDLLHCQEPRMGIPADYLSV